MIQELHKIGETLEKALGREPTQAELAESTNMSVVEVKRHLEVGQAARNKLIKVCKRKSSALCLFLCPSIEKFTCVLFLGFVLAQSPSRVICDEQIFPRLHERSEVSRPLSGWSQGTNHGDRSLRTEEETPTFDVWSFLDKACDHSFHDGFKLHPSPVRP